MCAFISGMLLITIFLNVDLYVLQNVPYLPFVFSHLVIF